jgi:NADH dehydrogenase [ubiquinone] 1 alpha subcomplex assembly factor 7
VSADEPAPLARKLARRIAQRITEDGPLSVADFMAAALTDPAHGYYMGRDPLGEGGDFITAPEISQMFGELIGLWCADTWQRLGAPPQVALVELGPGRGTLMADALRAARQDPAFTAALQVHLVEASPTLKARQAEALAGAEPTWHETLAGVPELPLLLIANEFFDALPVRQLVKQAGGWGERLVALAGESEALAFTVSPPDPALDCLMPESLRDAPAEQSFEVSPAGQEIARAIGRRLQTQGGAALIIDYGHETSALGETLQAVRRHAPHDVLSDPGTADLTCHVDFASLALAAREAGGVAAHGPVAQGAFLERLGIAARAARLMEQATPPQREDIRSARLRLTEPDQMGELFKVLALTREGFGPPSGFQ